jgi:hypothetical protein
MKYCPKCKTHKEYSEFAKCKCRNDGLQGYCRKCNNETKAKWQHRNNDKRRIYDKTYRKKLTDLYVAKILTQNIDLHQREIINQKELIESYRTIIKTKRICKTSQN